MLGKEFGLKMFNARKIRFKKVPFVYIREIFQILPESVFVSALDPDQHIINADPKHQRKLKIFSVNKIIFITEKKETVQSCFDFSFRFLKALFKS
jgi:hypothetical protein